MERARAAFDLAIVSVLLDAGAGAQWRYRDTATGKLIGRSEGLALASLDMFTNGAFSSEPRDPLRADATALMAVTPLTLSKVFQATAENPLVGLAGRATLLQALGARVAANPRVRAPRSGPAGRALRSSRRPRRRRQNSGAAYPVRSFAATRLDLAVTPDARRRGARRLLAASIAHHG